MVKTNKGFTLIELLVVIAIIGLLSSVVLASLNSARVKARDARRTADIKQLQTAFELYFDSCKQYPATLALTASNGCPSGTTLASFINSISADPLNTGTNVYTYSAKSDYTTYCITANYEGTAPAGASACPSGTTAGTGADYYATP